MFRIRQNILFRPTGDHDHSGREQPAVKSHFKEVPNDSALPYLLYPLFHPLPSGSRYRYPSSNTYTLKSVSHIQRNCKKNAERFCLLFSCRHHKRIFKKVTLMASGQERFYILLISKNTDALISHSAQQRRFRILLNKEMI